MGKYQEVNDQIQGIIDTPWNTRRGTKVPKTTEIALAGGAVEIEATFLYADLAQSSKMAKELDRRVAAKLIKCFLASSSKVIQQNGGAIRSFDGDRVMGIFHGDFKNSNAAKCAMQIKYVVHYLIKPKFERKYDSIKNASFSIDHGIGIDTGTVLSVRGGVRGDNDLVWIERAPNLAAKLSSLREAPYQAFVTARVYNKLNDNSKYGPNWENKWQSRSWNFLGDNMNVYRSSWWWKPGFAGSHT